jgi:hypothetical protein
VTPPPCTATLNLTPYTLQPSAYTLHLHLATQPFTLYPIPYTPQPTPYTSTLQRNPTPEAHRRSDEGEFHHHHPHQRRRVSSPPPAPAQAAALQRREPPQAPTHLEQDTPTSSTSQSLVARVRWQIHATSHPLSRPRPCLRSLALALALALAPSLFPSPPSSPSPSPSRILAPSQLHMEPRGGRGGGVRAGGVQRWLPQARSLAACARSGLHQHLPCHTAVPHQ